MEENLHSARQLLTKHLFLPLDSQMFKSSIVFSDKEITNLSIKRSFTFKDIKDPSHYFEIQDFLKEKANLTGIKMRIYFDLVWNERYKTKGTNLFLCNP